MEQEQLIQAMKNAEKKGNKEEAKRIAEYLLNPIVVTPEKPKYNKTSETVRSLASGALFEFGDEIEAGLRTLVTTGKIGGEEYKQLRDELRQKQKDFAKENPKLALGTKIAGGIVMPGGLVAKGATKAATVGKNIAQGSGYGALYGAGVAEEKSGIPKEMFENALIGGGTSGVLSGIGRAVSPKLQQGAKELQKQGIKLTPGQAFGGTTETLEQSATGIPLIGNLIKGSREASFKEFNRAAVNKSLEPLGKTIPKEATGRNIITEGRKIITKSYDEIAEKMTFKPESGIAVSFNKIIGQYGRDLDEKQIKLLRNVVDDVIDKTSKPMNGKQIQRLQQDIKKKMGRYAKSTGSDQAYFDSLQDVFRVLETNLQRQNPKLAKQMRDTNKAFGAFATVETAMAKARGADATFTPEALAGAVKTGDKSARKRLYSSGDLPLSQFSDEGISVLGSKVPDSGTTGRGLTSLLLGGGVGLVDPTAGVITGLSTLPYSNVGRNLFNTIVNESNRPRVIQNLGDYITKYAPITSTAGLLDLQNQMYGNK
tara:strand:+ start:979 stop:2598 length:1620 start_codon:yes stop_codon:yes gene_type:complete